MKNWNDIQKLEYDIKLHNELNQLYSLVSKLTIVALKRNLKLIIENPYSTTHHLRVYWCIRPKLIDKNRKDRGDYFNKPTQYWFINCEPKNNLIFEATTINALPVKNAISDIKPSHFKGEQKPKNRKVARSMIHPDYANRFIREFILD